ncbi:MAG: FKBP-type peptidyl-prolyl cis-trans isomerase [Pseudomonadota bacterium]
MRFFKILAVLAITSLAAACSQPADEPAAQTETDTTEDADVTQAEIETIDIAPGLTAKILRAGDGKVAAAGDNVTVHYTGWLFDETAENNRGQKFDSSVDRGQHFQFPLGQGRVIKGWDQGVAGMAIGEIRELTIAPEMAYGDRGAGGLIPPGATLVFEVELFDTLTLPSQ